jgi:hypothetical protein
MPELLRLQPKDFVKGEASGRFTNDGLFSDLSRVDIYRTPSNFGLLAPGFYGGGINPTSNNTIHDLVKRIINLGGSYFGYGNDGYLYSWSKGDVRNDNLTVLDSGNESGRANGENLTFYNGKLHYFYDTGIGTINVNGSSPNNTAYTTDITADPHPLVNWQGVLWFGNGNYLGKLDGTSLTAQFFKLPGDETIKDVAMYSNYIAILAVDSNADDINLSKLYLYDGYSAYPLYEYNIYENCTALESFRGELAIFGENLMFFNGGAFPKLKKLSSSVSYQGTLYYRNALYWLDSSEFNCYGAPINSLNDSFYSLMASPGTGGTIYPIWDNDNQFYASGGSTEFLMEHDSNGYQQYASATTIRFNLGNARIKRVEVYFEKLTENDAIEIQIQDPGAVASLYIDYSTDGAVDKKVFQPVTSLLNYMRLRFDWSYGESTSNNLRIKEIILYGNRERTP